MKDTSLVPRFHLQINENQNSLLSLFLVIQQTLLREAASVVGVLLVQVLLNFHCAAICSFVLMSIEGVSTMITFVLTSLSLYFNNLVKWTFHFNRAVVK